MGSSVLASPSHTSSVRHSNGMEEEGGALSRLERVAKEGSCAVLIQTKYRSRLAHKAAVKAAIKVQAAGRGSKVRRDLALMFPLKRLPTPRPAHIG